MGWLLGATARRFGWANSGALVGLIVGFFLGRLQEGLAVLVPLGVLVGIVGGLITRDGISAILLGGAVVGAVACTLLGAVGGAIGFPPWDIRQKHPVLGGLDGFFYGACLGAYAGWLLGARKGQHAPGTRRMVHKGMVVGSVVGGAMLSVLGALALPIFFGLEGPNPAPVNGFWTLFGFLIGGFLGTFVGALVGACLGGLLGTCLFGVTKSGRASSHGSLENGPSQAGG
jgi:hypothetical protein